MIPAKIKVGSASFLAVFSGFVLTIGFAPLFVAWFVPLAFVPLLLALENRDLRTSAALGGLSGAIYYFFGFHWVLFSICSFMSISWLVALPFYLLWILFESGQYILFALGVALIKKGNAFQFSFGVASLWTLLEYFYPKTFPWTVGSMWAASESIRQNVDWLGVYGLGFVTLWFNAFLAFHLFKGQKIRNIRFLFVPVIIFLLLFFYGRVRLGEERKLPSISVGLVNLDQTLAQSQPNRSKERLVMVKELLDKLESLDLKFMALPETLFRFAENKRIEEEFLQMVEHLKTPLLVGVEQAIENDRARNRVLLFEENKDVAQYDKRSLVAFAEYLPMAALPLWPKLLKKGNRFVAGKGVVVVDFADISLGLSICLEGAIPGWFNESVRQGATLLINISAENWSGPGFEPEQHLQLVQMRAIEARRWMVRVSDAGISTTIDSKGFLSHEQKVSDSGLVEKVALETEKTFYVRYGDWIIGLALLSLLMELAGSYLRREKNR